MKKRLSLLLAALLLAAPAAWAEGLTLEGTIEALSVRTVTAPYTGTVGDFDAEAGDAVQAGEALFPIAAQQLYADADGVVRGVFAQPGDNAQTVEARYGALLYLERDVLLEAACTSSGADSDFENRFVHAGETVYLKSTQNSGHKGVGRVTAVSAEGYQVELTLIDELNVGETVKVYRDSDYDSDSCIGSGRTSRVVPQAVTGQGYVLAMHVTDGQRVSRGDLLAELAPDALAGMQGGEAAAVMPEDGVLLSVSAQSGAQAVQDAVLATYCPAGALALVCPVDENDLPGLKVGARVSVTLDAFKDAPLYGEIVKIAGAANADGDFEVSIRLLETDNARIGMNASAQL